MNCPVCNETLATESALKCEHCDSNLASLKELERLVSQRKALRLRGTVLGSLLLVAILSIATWSAMDTGDHTMNASMVMTTDSSSHQITSLEQELNASKAQIDELNAQLTELRENRSEKPAEATNPKPLASTKKFHIVLPGQNVWKLSETYLGDGHRYPELTGSNAIENPDHIEVGDTIYVPD